MRILVTGGVRSGKSAHAERLLADQDAVTYVATGPEPSPDDEAWAERVRAHQARRPAHWSTARQVPASGAVLLDSLGTWVTAQVDELDGWGDCPSSDPRPSSLSRRWRDEYASRAADLIVALTSLDDLVVVTDEVGLGGVGADPATRLFADLLGDLNQQVGALCDAVHLVVAGRVLTL